MSIIIVLTVTLFVVSLAAFHVVLLRQGRFQLSPAQWEGVDYVWYGLSFLALLIASYQVVVALDRATHEEALRAIEQRYSQLEKVISDRLTAACPADRPGCNLLTDLHRAIKETRVAAGWPLAPIKHNGQVFDSLNALVKESAKSNRVSQVDGLVTALSTGLLEKVGEARAAEARMSRFAPPVWVTVAWPFLLALAIALRVTKVTYKVLEKSRPPTLAPPTPAPKSAQATTPGVPSHTKQRKPHRARR